ncbi:hypothetical protein CCB80_07785 [Armatimonadetes bacterium Uphvl-Ar1]|nr:hypothetical protein CCB80_07785 [Armatimonadetes bacterium Uphvl-Ar1]
MRTIFALVLSVLFFGGCISIQHIEVQDFETESNLTRQQGIPVTFNDIRKRLSHVVSDQNAAHFIAAITPSPEVEESIQSGLRSFTTDSAAIEQLRNAVKSQENALKQAERAGDLPGADFNRKWEKGYAVLFNEYRLAKYAASLLISSAVVCAEDGQHDRAILQLRRAGAIANHILEPVAISDLVWLAIRRIQMKTLLRIAYRHPDQPSYIRFAETQIDSWPDWKFIENLHNDLPSLLAIYESSKTIKLAKELLGVSAEYVAGLKDADPEPRFTEGKALIIKYFREAASTLTLNDFEAEARRSEIEERILKVLDRNPIAKRIIQDISPIFPSAMPRHNSESNRILWDQTIRFLKAPYRISEIRNVTTMTGLELQASTAATKGGVEITVSSPTDSLIEVKFALP